MRQQVIKKILAFFIFFSSFLFADSLEDKYFKEFSAVGTKILDRYTPKFSTFKKVENSKDKYDILSCGEMGIGNTTSTAAIASAMLKLSPELTVGRGTGINDERLQIKRRVVAEGLAVNAPIADDALDVLCKLGGYDHAGLAGMILGGARRGIPTMIDGVNATAAAMLAWGIYPECADYMLCSHLSEEIAHRRMLSQLNLHPIVDAGMRLGEGTGASLAVVVLQTALGLYKEMNRQ